MMLGITPEQRDRLWTQLTQMQAAELTDKDREVLTGIMHSEPMLKALGRIYAVANSAPSDFVKLDLMMPDQLGQAIRLQGTVQGIVSVVDMLFALITLPEGEEDDVTEPSV